MLLSSQSFTRIMLIFFIGLYLISFINETNADETRMQKISNFSIDINEVTIGDFYRFVTSTNYKTKAERRGWGYVYEFGWVQKRGWNWKNPYGVKGEGDEPAVHVNFDEAQMFCQWSNKRLPNERNHDFFVSWNRKLFCKSFKYASSINLFSNPYDPG